MKCAKWPGLHNKFHSFISRYSFAFQLQLQLLPAVSARLLLLLLLFLLNLPLATLETGNWQLAAIKAILGASLFLLPSCCCTIFSCYCSSGCCRIVVVLLLYCCCIALRSRLLPIELPSVWQFTNVLACCTAATQSQARQQHRQRQRQWEQQQPRHQQLPLATDIVIHV